MRKSKLHLAVTPGLAGPATHNGGGILWRIAAQRFGGRLNPGHQLRVAQQVGDPVLRQPGLPRAKHFARAAQLEIPLRDDKAVICVA